MTEQNKKIVEMLCSSDSEMRELGLVLALEITDMDTIVSMKFLCIRHQNFEAAAILRGIERGKIYKHE